MTKQEFLNEAKAYIEECYTQFEEYQENVNDVLDVFHDLCKKNGVHYYVAYGSLLGLIRDGGDIPWDYDIDVMVPITERQKLLDMLGSGLPEDYYYVYYNNMSDYPAECLRVCKKGCSYMALHLDVFFLIGCPNAGAGQDAFRAKVREQCVKRTGKFAWRHLESENASGIRRVTSKLARIRYAFTTSNSLRRMDERLCNMYPYGKTEECIAFSLAENSFRTDSFGEGKEIEVKGHLRMVPDDYDDFLTRKFGDYKEYMPISTRFDEFYGLYKIVDQRQKYYREHQMKK